MEKKSKFNSKADKAWTGVFTKTTPSVFVGSYDINTGEITWSLREDANITYTDEELKAKELKEFHEEMEEQHLAEWLEKRRNQ